MDEDDIGGRFGSPAPGEIGSAKQTPPWGYQCKYTMRYDQPDLFLIIHIHKNSMFYACVFVS